MSNIEVTEQSMKEALIHEKRFKNRKLQRSLYKALFSGSPVYSDEEYRALSEEV